MKKFIPITLFLAILNLTTSCKKTSVDPTSKSNATTMQTTKHFVDPGLVGTWMWTDASDGAHFDDNGTYIGSAYGLATQYTIGADGYGSFYSHI